MQSLFLSHIKKWRAVVADVTFFVVYLKIVGNVSRIEIIHNNAKVHKQKWMIDWYDFFFCGKYPVFFEWKLYRKKSKFPDWMTNKVKPIIKKGKLSSVKVFPI